MQSTRLRVTSSAQQALQIGNSKLQSNLDNNGYQNQMSNGGEQIRHHNESMSLFPK